MLRKIEDDFQVKSSSGWTDEKLAELQAQIQEKVNKAIVNDLQIAKRFISKELYEDFCESSLKHREKFIDKAENSISPTPYGKIDTRTLAKVFRREKTNYHARIRHCFSIFAFGAIVFYQNEESANETLQATNHTHTNNHKLDLLLFTDWKVFYFHYDEDLRKGFLGMALLKIEGYDNVQVKNIGSETSNNYLGNMQLEKSNQHITFELNGVLTKEKHLRITVFVGIDKIYPLLLGVYTNIYSSNSIVAGTIVLEKVKNDSDMEDLFPMIIDFDDCDKTGIDTSIASYLNSRFYNFIKAPSGILTKQKLAQWIELQKRRKN